MEILKTEKLNFKYPNTEEKVLTDFSFSVEKGEFVLMCGRTGSSKSTLLRLLMPSLSPSGEKSGTVLFHGEDIYSEKADIKATIGFVFQNPELQIVSDKVYSELAFGLENLNINSEEIRNKVCEIADYFGLSDVIGADTSTLSGGKKQLLALASIAVMRPEILLLDEPTSSLDPVAAEEFITILCKLNREFGITIIISEHRLHNIIPHADRVLVLEDGKNIFYDSPDKICSVLQNREYLFDYLPPTVKLYAKVSESPQKDCPLTIRDGKKYLEHYIKSECIPLTHENSPEKGTDCDMVREYAFELNNISFRYQKSLPDVLSDFTLKIKKGEFFCLMGANASGKTTALKIAGGILCPYEGKIKIDGKSVPLRRENSEKFNKIISLPQDASLVFTHDTIAEEFEAYDLSKLPFDISAYMKKNPTDLSGGEAQLCAIAKALLKNPKILLLDEPTRGIDPHTQKMLIFVLKNLQKAGMTILAVTHDAEFAAECANRCGRIFNGKMLLCDTPRNFFANNYFYTTSSRRLCRDFFPNVITDGDMIKMITKNQSQSNESTEGKI